MGAFGKFMFIGVTSTVDKEYERAISLGAKPVFAPTTEPWGQRTCYIADPEGNYQCGVMLPLEC